MPRLLPVVREYFSDSYKHLNSCLEIKVLILKKQILFQLQISLFWSHALIKLLSYNTYNYRSDEY